jgi:hypothetical protein
MDIIIIECLKKVRPVKKQQIFIRQQQQGGRATHWLNYNG